MARSRTRVTLNPNLEAQVQRMVAPKIEAYQKELNEVLSACKGQPVDELHEALVELTRRHGIEPNVDSLRKLAEEHGA